MLTGTWSCRGVSDYAHQLPQGNQLTLLGFWIGNAPGAEIEELELCNGPPIRRTRAGRGPIQGQIVQADELVIGAEVNVALQPEGDLGLPRPLNRCLIRRPCHLRMPRGEAAMGDQDRRNGHRLSGHTRQDVTYGPSGGSGMANR